MRLLFAPIATIAPVAPLARARRFLFSATWAAPLLVLGWGLVAGCDNNDLPAASLENFEDTATVSALVGTPLLEPSAFSVADRQTIRTDQSSSFDFAYNVDAIGRSVFLSRAVLGLGSSTGADPGFLKTSTPFDGITKAQQNGYITDDTVSVAEGERYYVRSRITCGIGVPLYGKIEILDVDTALRQVTFRYLINGNCGYRSLEPGIPQE